jgi:hypothetical protein
MDKISKSPTRGTFQIDRYLKRCEDAQKDPCKEYINFYESSNIMREELEQDPAWSKNNLEYDLRTTEWILNKVRSSTEYSGNLYSALCNNEFIKREMWQLLKEDTWSCSWRYAGGIIADMREEGDYIDWYCHGNEGQVTLEIKDDLYKLGWIVVKNTEV